MKCLKVASAIALAIVASPAFAALTCAAPTTLTQAGVLGIDGCSGSNGVPTFCVFNSNPSPDLVFQFHLGSGFTATQVTLTNHSAGFQPQMVIQSSCGSSTDCTATANAAAGGGNLSLAFSSASPAMAAGNSYFLVVSGTSSSSATDCGTFDLGFDGTLPIKLQKFSVQ